MHSTMKYTNYAIHNYYAHDSQRSRCRRSTMQIQLIRVSTLNGENLRDSQRSRCQFSTLMLSTINDRFVNQHAEMRNVLLSLTVPSHKFVLHTIFLLSRVFSCLKLSITPDIFDTLRKLWKVKTFIRDLNQTFYKVYQNIVSNVYPTFKKCFSNVF